MARRSLRALADAVGILPSYVDQSGIVREASDEVRVALLAAMGLDAASEAGAKRALAELALARRDRLLPPVTVTQRAPVTLDVAARSLTRRGEPVEWQLAVTTEAGERHAASGRSRAGADGSLRLRLPVRLPLGYHEIRLGAGGGAARREADQTVIVTPARCPIPADRRDRRRVGGLLVNLYTTRSARNWGAGDFGDLGDLVAWCGDLGAAFVGVNPLHAITNRDDDISPYRPISRLYRNPLYLDVEAIPELRESTEARTRLASAGVRRELGALRAAPYVEYARVMALKQPFLESLHQAFVARHRDRDTARGRAYRDYRAREGASLDDFATFMALLDVFGTEPARRDWHTWPAELRDPRGPAVAELRRARADAVDFHRWLQFELDRQLATIAADAAARGVPIGVYQDLAIGSAPSGSDTWAFRDLFLDDASVGAPPDEYCAAGQNWGLPPIDPHRLAADRYRYWTRLVRNALQHAGALRIDHVMGLFRQFWIPAGASGAGGAYVAFPSEDLLGILALESTRAGALVVGEDLGTVPRGLPARLARRGVLSTRVLYFARTKRGAFVASDAYPERALVSANTHDMAPLAGFWEDRDLTLRRTAGILETDEALAAARAARRQERAALSRRLWAEGCLPQGREPADDTELIAAVHAFLAKTPAALVGISLDDLAREHDPVNLPGVGAEGYRSWSRRLGRTLAELRADPAVARMLAGIRARLRVRRPTRRRA